MNEIISNSSGYLILDHRFRWYTSNPVKREVKTNSRMVNDKWKDIQIYRFDSNLQNGSN